MKLKINKGRENKFYVSLMAFVIISFLVIFTSKLWMYDDNPIKQTPFNKDVIGLEQTTLILKKWHYNPEKGFMEVLLETRYTGSDNVKPTFAFAAKASKTLESYPVKIIYQKDNQFVLHISEVPQNYSVIGLFVKEIRDKKILESEARDKLFAEKGAVDPSAVLDLPQPKEKIIVGDYRKISEDKTLKEKTEIAYQEEFIALEIEQIVKKIHTLEKEQLPLQDDIIASIQNEMKQLESELVYKTEDEKKEVHLQLVKKKTAIENVNEKKKEYQNNLLELQNKRKKLQQKIEMIRSGEKKKEAAKDASV
ncbi:MULTISPECIES: hypothetical protein [Lysinibacillus]|uniref:hypothetical protein n=1 Tax=Lysinibacillus TaxID=400634 RepID=UPI0006935FF2|nr:MULTISPECIES: hypothetical protein [Lysinibacillus]MEE3808818.1 hypothetical protein [Lysinibacillus fusiformis]